MNKMIPYLDFPADYALMKELCEICENAYDWKAYSKNAEKYADIRVSKIFTNCFISFLIQLIIAMSIIFFGALFNTPESLAIARISSIYACYEQFGVILFALFQKTINDELYYLFKNEYFNNNPVYIEGEQ